MAAQTAPDGLAANRRRTRITVVADHGRPVGVAILRSFRTRAISWADLSANSVKMGRNRSARSLAAALVSFGMAVQPDGADAPVGFGGPLGPVIVHRPERPCRSNAAHNGRN
jgi:hypothetical protein